jgi:hypothetical protein
MEKKKLEGYFWCLKKKKLIFILKDNRS